MTIAVMLVMACQIAAQRADLSKMSPLLADILSAYAAESRSTGARTAGSGIARAQGEEYVLALVKLTDDDERTLTECGCRVINHSGHISIALLPVSRLAALSMDHRVMRMEANPLSRPLMDITPGIANVLPAYQGQQLPQAYTGRGVVVGVCDVGLDFTHPAFCDANGQTRIRQAWDIYTGANSGYAGVGTLYTTPGQIAAAGGTSDSLQYHGTHVAAIAAGRSLPGSDYQGIAYDADLVMSLTFLNGYTDAQYQALIASLNATLKDGTADGLVTDVVHNRIILSSAMEALAVRHIIDYAEAHQQPCVVNCSFGSQQTLTRDDSLLEELMNSMTGPGRIIVCSAGNYSDGILYKVKPAGSTMDERLWLKGSMTPTITLRSAGDFTLKVGIDIKGADTLCLSTADIRLAEGMTLKDSARIDGPAMNDWLRAEAKAYPQADGRTAYSLQLTLPTPTTAYSSPSFAVVIEGDAEVEVMGSSRAATFNRLNTDGYVNNAPYTVVAPALFSQMVAVGLTSHRDSVTNTAGERITFDYNHNALGQVVSWSGTGPALDGRMKPDVVAPGHNVISAMNSHCALSNLTTSKQRQIVGQTTVGGKDYLWKVESGSSMAAPVVTGIIALWLQANPQLTPSDVKLLIAQTARHPEPDETYPNYRYGYGEIDAYQGLLQLTHLSGVEGLSTHQPRQMLFELDGRTLTLSGAPQATVTVFTLGGQVVLRTSTADGAVSLDSLRPGVYAVQADTPSAATTGSTLIRLD